MMTIDATSDVSVDKLDDTTMAGRCHKLAKLLSLRGCFLATAESCTGGGLAYMLTSVSGASQWYKGSVIAYSNDVKVNALNVDNTLIKTQGAVSQEVAIQMAQGVNQQLGSDISIAITGVAGPSGGSIEKPVGTVCFAVAQKDKKQDKTYASCLYFEGSRHQIQQQAIEEAIQQLIRALCL